MTSQTPAPPLWSTRTIHLTFGAFPIHLQVIEDFDTVLNHCVEMHPDDTSMIPYYAELWPSAEALGHHLVQTYSTLSGKRVIELGCGLGLPSILCGKLGADVTATDFHPHNEAYFKQNAADNDLTTIDYRQMDWSSPKLSTRFDIVIGSDLLYESQQIESLTRCIHAILKPGGTVILADPGRDHIQAAVDGLAMAGFSSHVAIIDEIFIVTLRAPD